LGGSFNPAHDGHRHIALQALRRLGLDQVWLMVSPQNPLKSSAETRPLSWRVESARRVAAGHPALRVTAMETQLGTRYTADTLAALLRRFPRVDFVWLMGADNLAQIHLWTRWTRIFRTVPVAILARAPYSERALAAKASRRFSRFRCPSGAARGLGRKHLPAWVFLHIRRHPASSTALRASAIAA
jgi:nicotinate-nucleotide adenylyltransferase